MLNVREFKQGGQAAWSKDQILAGLQQFFRENDRYPTAHEIDDYKYLPSSRSIQRTYGGLVNLRRELIPESHHDHTKGAYRSELASIADKRARDYEEAFNKLLTYNFQEIAVHEHKVIRPGNVASDFFLYLNESAGVVIDLFYAKSIRVLSGIVTIKLKRYRALPYEVYFVLVANNEITQTEIDSQIANRRTLFPDHINVITEQEFVDTVMPGLKLRSEFVK